HHAHSGDVAAPLASRHAVDGLLTLLCLTRRVGAESRNVLHAMRVDDHLPLATQVGHGVCALIGAVFCSLQRLPRAESPRSEAGAFYQCYQLCCGHLTEGARLW